ncbi:MAG: zinc-dependent alcohol dehydrogenase [Candidatus Sumerlaeaceae bacterium]
MKAQQIVVNKGRPVLRAIELGELPERFVRVRVRFSGISAGTELAIIRRSALEPESTLALGYQAVGDVIAAGAGVQQIAQGTVVACYGAPYVCHASFLDVPERLCAPVQTPEPIPEQSFCGLGTIALHAVRLGAPQLGDIVAVVGMGFLGNLVAQLATCAGGRVIAVESHADRRAMAQSTGLVVQGTWEDLAREIESCSEGHGADVAFMVAHACGNDLLEKCVRLLRLRGQLVIVGAADAVLPRDALFEKEASLLVSRAGGPGRYDLQYEEGKVDYPYGYVRWTEGRNLREFVRLMSEGRVTVEPLVTTVVSAAQCGEIYSTLANQPGKYVGVAFDWSEVQEQ